MNVLYDPETKTSFRLERNAQGRLVINIKGSEVGPHITYNDAILYASGYASASAGGRLSGNGGVAGSSPGTGLGGAGYSGSGASGGSSGSADGSLSGSGGAGGGA